MKMNSKTAAKADSYRLQRATTPEGLELKMMHGGGAVLTFSDRILVAGYYYNHTCEGRVELVSISEDTFEDNGHAIAWAMAN